MGTAYPAKGSTFERVSGNVTSNSLIFLKEMQFSKLLITCIFENENAFLEMYFHFGIGIKMDEKEEFSFLTLTS